MVDLNTIIIELNFLIKNDKGNSQSISKNILNALLKKDFELAKRYAREWRVKVKRYDPMFKDSENLQNYYNLFGSVLEL